MSQATGLFFQNIHYDDDEGARVKNIFQMCRNILQCQITVNENYIFDFCTRRHASYHTGRLRLKMQKIHRVNLVRLNLLKSREIIERH